MLARLTRIEHSLVAPLQAVISYFARCGVFIYDAEEAAIIHTGSTPYNR